MGVLLREWRQRRRLSQLDLALAAGVSSRHVSFVETGRTVPSPPMIERLAEQLNIPLRERNRLLVAAGYAPVHRHRPLHDPGLVEARAAVQRVLDGHAPYPALAVDRQWNLLLANNAVRVFLDDIHPALLAPPINMMRLGLHPQGFAPRLRNLEQVRGFLLPRLARLAAYTGDAELAALHDELAGYGAAPENTPLRRSDIALPIRIVHGDTELCFFSTVMTFGTAFDVTLEEIAIESYFPADPATAEYLHALAGAAEPVAALHLPATG